MAYDEKLADAWRGELATLDGVSEKKMMGGLCFLLNGNMLGTTRDDYFMFRVGKDNEAEVLKRKGASRMQMGDKKCADSFMFPPLSAVLQSLKAGLSW